MRHLLNVVKTNAVHSINRWTEAINDEIKFLRNSEIARQLLERIISRPNGQSKENFSKLIQPIIERHQYRNFFVLSKEDEIVYASRFFDSSTSNFLKQTLHEYVAKLRNDTLFWLISSDRPNGQAVLYGFLKVSYSKDKTNSPLLFVASFNVKSTILPLIDITIPGKTSFEMSMILHNRDSVYPIAPPKFEQKKIGESGFSIKGIVKPTVQLSLGSIGFGDGIDYRGEKVFFFSDKVPQIMNTTIVAKIDKKEALGNFNIILLLASTIHIIFFGSFALLIKYYIKKIRNSNYLPKLNLNILLQKNMNYWPKMQTI